MSMQKITLLDTTLRDGAQAEGISFSLEDKLKIALTLDKLGVDFIEAGNPGSNPKDAAFFAALPKLTHARVAAFGATRRAHVRCEDDPGVRTLADSGASVVTLFGKAWDFHVTHVLRATLEENLAMIADTVAYLRGRGMTVIFDAEHYFDGYKANPAYAIQALLAAQGTGASLAALCDTNGGTLPRDIARITQETLARLQMPVGIHTHNDSGLAVASTLAAVEAGATHVQGTINGIGERCGNANLCAVLPNLILKMGLDCLTPGALSGLTQAARFVSEVANVALDERSPYVGNSAFAHKGGMHVDGVLKASATFEHIDPEQVGNQRRLLLSEVSGRALLKEKLKALAPELLPDGETLARIAQALKEKEAAGYQYEDAEASFALMVAQTLGQRRQFFEVVDFKAISDKPGKPLSAQAMIKVRVDGQEEITAAEGDGPVNALDAALRKALTVFYPQLAHMRLTDYKVRVLDTLGTASTTRVKIASTDGSRVISTVGVSSNIIDASFQALCDSIDYLLMGGQG